MDPEVSLEVFHGLPLNKKLDGKRVGLIDVWEDEKVECCVWIKYVYVLKKYRETGTGTRAVEMSL